MLTEFEGKVAVVTGAASGIGKAMCLRFADAGMKDVPALVGAAERSHSIELDALRAHLGSRGLVVEVVGWPAHERRPGLVGPVPGGRGSSGGQRDGLPVPGPRARLVRASLPRGVRASPREGAEAWQGGGLVEVAGGGLRTRKTSRNRRVG